MNSNINFASVIGALVYLALAIYLFIGMGKAFAKAGQPAWGCIVPFYNIHLMNKMAGKPGWFFFLWLIPILNLAAIAVVFIEIAKRFKKGIGFGIGMFFLSAVFFAILGYGKSEYTVPPTT